MNKKNKDKMQKMFDAVREALAIRSSVQPENLLNDLMSLYRYLPLGSSANYKWQLNWDLKEIADNFGLKYEDKQ